MKVLGFALVIALAGAARAQEAFEGQWHAWLDSPGGELPFLLELHVAEKRLQATIINASERIDVEASPDGDDLVLDFPHYDSRITAHGTGARLDGTWRKRRGADAWAELGFHADRNVRLPGTEDAAPIFRQLEASVAHRYAVRFSGGDDPAVALLEADAAGLRGTFLTTTGDYRYLAGECTLPATPGSDTRVLHVRLSCFDGAHAFLFSARLVPRSTPGPVQLEGDFWSGDHWHETWTATEDTSARLPDGFTLSRASGAVTLDDLVFPDLEGTPRRLSDPQFAGKARVIEVFGSWCPNCADEADELVRLQQEYGARGLSIVGLAFEVTGDFARDAGQVRRYAARHGVTWPLLVAGLADKDKATASLGLLDKVRAFPTTIFLDEAGAVRAVYTGFSGPATGAAHEEQHADFVRVIEELLAPAAKDGAR